jgi:hypothetical protein
MATVHLADLEEMMVLGLLINGLSPLEAGTNLNRLNKLPRASTKISKTETVAPLLEAEGVRELLFAIGATNLVISPENALLWVEVVEEVVVVL